MEFAFLLPSDDVSNSSNNYTSATLFVVEYCLIAGPTLVLFDAGDFLLAVAPPSLFFPFFRDLVAALDRFEVTVLFGVPPDAVSCVVVLAVLFPLNDLLVGVSFFLGGVDGFWSLSVQPIYLLYCVESGIDCKNVDLMSVSRREKIGKASEILEIGRAHV